ncbi:hypothetical protein [Natranaerobius thermophilus]|uniref:Uncharacterized protein n=1 Tax=Natranaerobius thermophilus (strain ATCC BAA-1301 / DSM 18059 / JW/NM-WN-LF) TaxID=457570 RepID=B2A3C2_NATTJ|nr:hypothetical protein [Natranaerobius thermophilus]ACB85052.1 hypothetical protein Nther_1469 [Natranaerobius thermophilus JW/NM-WN-LF]
MRKNKDRLLIIFLTSLIGIVIITGGYFIWRQQEIITPIESYLNDHEQIKDYEIIERDTRDLKVVLEIEYTPFVNTFYQEIDEELSELAGEDELEIELADNKSSSLEEISYELNYLIWQYSHSGEYTKLLDKLDELEQEYALDHIQVHLSQDGFFVQIRDDNSYIWEIVEYPTGLGKDDLTDDNRS